MTDEKVVEAKTMNFYRVSGGSSFMGMMTDYGWMEGTPDQIREQIRRHVELEEKKKDKSNPYNADLVMEDTERVNGYQMYKTERPIVEERYYEKMIELWNKPDYKDFDEFVDKCELCSDWYKQDEHGECFGGFWKYPEDSYEKQNAFDMSYRKNIVELYRLPYPDAVLIETVNIGCSNRRESVRYSATLCEWIARKYEQLNGERPRSKKPVFKPDWDEHKYIYES